MSTDTQTVAGREQLSDGLGGTAIDEVEPTPAAIPRMGRHPRHLVAYLQPFRFDHWIKNLVVPAGSALALVAHDAPVTPVVLEAALLGFVVSGLVSSVNYAINEILDAPFDARH